MFRLALRSLLARKLRLLLSASSVVLGVAFVVGAFVVTDTLGRSFTDAFAVANEDIAVAVRGAEVTDGPGAGSGDRDEVPEDAVGRLEQVDGVAEVKPSVSTSAAGEFTVLGSDGEAMASTGAPMFAGNWIESERLNQQRVTEGRPPQGPGEVTYDAALAERAGVGVGDTTQIFALTGQREVRVVGLTRYADGTETVGGESYVFFSTEAARELLGVKGFTEVYVAADGVAPEELRQRVQDALPAGLEAVTGSRLADERAEQVQDGLGFLNTFLLVFASVALFTGAFIIFNTFSILVAQRTRELALMRALGASKAQVTWSVLLEALVVGGISSIVGLGAGIGVAIGLQELFGATGSGLPSAAPVIGLRTVVAAIATGVLITVASALLPAQRAAKVPPVTAMRDAATADRSLRGQTIAGTVCTVAGAAAMALGLTGRGLLVLGIGTMLAFVGVTLLSPLASRPVAGGLGVLFARTLSGRLGRQNALRNPRRTATTAAALMIGLALVAAVGVLGASLKASVRSGASAALASDVVITPTAVGLDPKAFAAIRESEGVGEVTGLRGGAALLDGESATPTAVSRAALGATLRLDERDGSAGELGPGTLLVADDVAAERGLSVGSTVPVEWEDGAGEDLRVVGVYGKNQVVGDYLVDESAADHFARQLYVAVLVTAAKGTDPGRLTGTLERSLEAYPNLRVQPQAEFVADATRQIDQLVRFFQLLLAMSVGIAVLGVVNTLALSVLERTRELGLLRAVGMSRRQVRNMVTVESVLVSVFGGVLGLAVGVVFGIALQRALADQGIGELAFPVLQLLGCLLLAGLAGVAAAWLPARRAARLDVLQAVAGD